MFILVPVTFTGLLVYLFSLVILGMCEEGSCCHDFEMNDREEIEKKSSILARPIEKLLEWSEKCDWL